MSLQRLIDFLAGVSVLLTVVSIFIPPIAIFPAALDFLIALLMLFTVRATKWWGVAAFLLAGFAGGFALMSMVIPWMTHLINAVLSILTLLLSLVALGIGYERGGVVEGGVIRL